MNDVNTQPFGLTVDSRLSSDGADPQLGLPSSVKGIEQSAGYAGPSGGCCIMSALFFKFFFRRMVCNNLSTVLSYIQSAIFILI